ncbi:MAG: alpha-beta hydrolase superfamily lysophospholipase [Paracoccaceae bacterium]|jgi:alpha-beta hydrolase superfamily lysophospholipase
MRKFGKLVGRAFVVLIVIATGMWWFGPYEDNDLSSYFETRKFGEGVGVYFESIESRYKDITPGTEKRVIWAGPRETRTPYSVVYLHGYSATSEEIRPVPDLIAKALGANLFYTRLRGHGRDGKALADATVSEWMYDTAEALATGRAVGDKVIVLSTSTGGTMAAAAAMDAKMSKDIAAMIFVSPNFGINDPAAPLLTWPAARYWVPLVVGQETSSEPVNEQHEMFWTNSYPTKGLTTLAALIQAVVDLDFTKAEIPALFWLSDDDQVVRPDISRDIAKEWGGPAAVHAVTMGPDDDKGAHVIAGVIRSPGQTDAAVVGMLDWLNDKGIK